MSGPHPERYCLAFLEAGGGELEGVKYDRVEQCMKPATHVEQARWDGCQRFVCSGCLDPKNPHITIAQFWERVDAEACAALLGGRRW